MKIKGFEINIKKYFQINSVRVWVILLSLFLLVNFIVLSYSVFLYFRIDNGTAFFDGATDNENSVLFERIRKSELEKIISYFESKQEKFEGLSNRGVGSIIDPSI